MSKPHSVEKFFERSPWLLAQLALLLYDEKDDPQFVESVGILLKNRDEFETLQILLMHMAAMYEEARLAKQSQSGE